MSDGHGDSARPVHFLRTRVLRLVGWDLSGRVAAQVFGVYIAHQLGPYSYGLLSVGLVVAGLLSVVADAGIGEAGVRWLTLAPDGSDTFKRSANLIRVRIALGFGLIGLITSIVVASPLVRVAGAASAGIIGVISISGYAYRARIASNFKTAGRGLASLAIGPVAAAAAGVALFHSALGAASMSSATAVLVSVFLQAGTSRYRIDRCELMLWLSRGLPFLLTALAVATYSRIDRIFVAVMVNTAEAGRYTAAYNVLMASAIVGSSIQSALMPELLKAAQSAHHSFATINSACLRIVGLSAPVAGLLILFRHEVIALLYGNSYAGASALLVPLSLMVPGYLLNPYLSARIVAYQREAAVTKIALLNVVTALVLYPLFVTLFCAKGAAIASVMVEAQGSVMLYMTLRRVVKRRQGPSAY